MGFPHRVESRFDRGTALPDRPQRVETASHGARHRPKHEFRFPLRDTLTIVQSGIADFYRDKEVITVQQATEGNVDLVFMGDGDTIDDMATQNGYYETSLRKAVDYFFDVEPYRTYRNYFNVYIVCAVSNEPGAFRVRSTIRAKRSTPSSRSPTPTSETAAVWRSTKNRRSNTLRPPRSRTSNRRSSS